jgi:hypothetical protein
MLGLQQRKFALSLCDTDGTLASAVVIAVAAGRHLHPGPVNGATFSLQIFKENQLVLSHLFFKTGLILIGSSKQSQFFLANRVVLALDINTMSRNMNADSVYRTMRCRPPASAKYYA